MKSGEVLLLTLSLIAALLLGVAFYIGNGLYHFEMSNQQQEQVR